MKQTARRLAVVGVLASSALLLAALPAAAEPRTSSHLLLPYFEVDVGGARTTLFAVGNGQDEPVRVRATVATNWGIAVLRVTLDLGPGEVRTVNLRDWIEDGALPTQTLGSDLRAHLEAALTGQASPRDGLYYGSEVEPGLAIGSVRLLVEGSPRAESLWGDYFWIDAAGDSAEGGHLLDVSRGDDCAALCDRHLVRFLDTAGLDPDTELVVWTGLSGGPSPVPEPQFVGHVTAGHAFYREDGTRFDERMLSLLPTQTIRLADLALVPGAGWIDVLSSEPVFIAARHSSPGRFAVSVQSWCQRDPLPAPSFQASAGIDIEKATNGMDADLPLGPVLQIGSEVHWTYQVTNTGNVGLSGIVVSDNRGVTVSCPRASLAPGQSMTCTASGTVEAGPYSNIGTVTGTPSEGPPVTDSDPSHYNGANILPNLGPAIDVEKLTNGHQADDPPGPTLIEGDPVTWTYSVTNVGSTTLTGVAVDDSDPAVTVSCPKTTLGITESMVCSASGTVGTGAYSNTATASAEGDGTVVSDADASHYFGEPAPPPEPRPAVRIEKLTNGFDADGVGSAPQLVHGDAVTWTYVVRNTGNVVLSDVEVGDDQGVAVSCPQTTLQPGEEMVCTGSGSAVASEHCYCNVGVVVASPPEGDDVTDSDPSHYCAEPVPGEASIAVEKTTNGADADVAPGPTLTVGDNVQWEYVVENTGDVALSGVTVTDDQGVVVTCEGGQPFSLTPGETKTCFGNGTAELGQYANVASAEGTPVGGGANVSDTDPSHYFGEEEEDEEECRVCAPSNPDSGKINSLLMEYTGFVPDAEIEVFLSNSAECGSPGQQLGEQVFDDTVDPGDTFLLARNPSLGTSIALFVDGVCNAVIHTSCSEAVFPGYTAGDFEVVEGTTRSGEGDAPLCPLEV